MSDASPEPSGTSRIAKDSTERDAAPKKPARRILGRRAGLVLLALLVLAFAAVGTSSYWRPVIEPLLSSRPQAEDPLAAVNERLTTIERRLDALAALEDRITALERRPAPDASAAIAPLQDQLQQLSTRLAAVEARLTQLVKDQTMQGDSAQRVLIVALADLGNAVSTSRPFATQLASVEALGQARPGWGNALRPLEASAKAGIPSTAVLTQRFSDEVAAAILRADAATPDPQSGFGEAILARLRALVIVRRTDGTSDSGNPVDAAVATAEAALTKGDLAGAVAALGNLSGKPAAAAAAWLQQAQQRLDAEQAIATLTQQLSSDLAAGGG